MCTASRCLEIGSTPGFLISVHIQIMLPSFIKLVKLNDEIIFVFYSTISVSLET
jgi:hypothetical protein